MLATVLKTPDEEIDEYLQVLTEMADASGGGITDPPFASLIDASRRARRRQR